MKNLFKGLKGCKVLISTGVINIKKPSMYQDVLSIIRRQITDAMSKAGVKEIRYSFGEIVEHPEFKDDPGFFEREGKALTIYALGR